MSPEILQAFRDELNEIEKEAFVRSGAAALAQRAKVPLSKAKEWLKARAEHAAHGVIGGKSLKPGEVSALEEAAKFAKNPIKTSKKSFKDMHLPERALFGGVTGIEAADILKTPPHERGNRLGSLAGGTAGWLAFRKAPLVGSIVGTMGAAKAGEALSKKLGDTVRRKKIELVHGQ